MIIMFILSINLALFGNIFYYTLRQKGQNSKDYRMAKYYFKQADIAERIAAGGSISLIIILMFSAVLFV